MHVSVKLPAACKSHAVVGKRLLHCCRDRLATLTLLPQAAAAGTLTAAPQLGRWCRRTLPSAAVWPWTPGGELCNLLILKECKQRWQASCAVPICPGLTPTDPSINLARGTHHCCRWALPPDCAALQAWRTPSPLLILGSEGWNLEHPTALRGLSEVPAHKPGACLPRQAALLAAARRRCVALVPWVPC